ncbi:MAG: molybdate ABC transporter permease subunit [Spirochaetota bacterium]
MFSPGTVSRQFRYNEMNAYLAEVIWLTLRVAAASTALSLPAALLIGYKLARTRRRIRPVAEALISFPLVAPPVVSGYLMLLLLGKNSWLGELLYRTAGVHFTFNFAALVAASVVVSFPLAVRSIRASFELVDPAYENASLTLGASRLYTFFRVSVPMAAPGIISGMVLSFARSLGEFGASITLAGNIPGRTQTISLLVYSNMQVPGKEQEAALLVLVSVCISFAAIAVSEYFSRQRKPSHT